MTPLTENRLARDFESLRPRLRADLRFSLQDHSGERVCLIEDPVAAQFHRVGIREFLFIHALDGRRSIAEILADLARKRDQHGLSDQDARQILSWLRQQSLLVVNSAQAGAAKSVQRSGLAKASKWLNPLSLRVPLAHPDRFFTRLEPSLRWALGWPGFCVWLIVLTTAAVKISMDWPRFAEGYDGFLARDNWIGMLVVWVLLKCVHEFGHGLFCKHYGAAVREVGAIFVLFLPIGYVDATASLGLPSRRQRMMVAAAGLYVELFFAALAGILWSATAPGFWNTLAHNAVITGTVVTLFFNANPLMRFDGYFLLSEAVDIPNLATRGRTWWMRALTGLLTGAPQAWPKRPRTREEWFIAVYGVLAWCWQIVVIAGLIAAATVMLQGGGLLFAALATVLWLVLPIIRFGKNVAQIIGSRPTRWLNFAFRAAVLAAVAALILWLPSRRMVSAPAAVELAETTIVRADASGFVEKVHVHDGQEVRAGDLLVTLRNEQLTEELERSRWLERRQALKARVAYTKGEVAMYQAEQARLGAMQTALKERERFVASLEVRAPRDGQVQSRYLDRLAGRFFKHGGEILQVGRSDALDLRVAVAQSDENSFRAVLGQPVEVRVEGDGRVLTGRVSQVGAGASREPPHPALTALAGGPLSLRRQAGEEDRKSSSGAENYELAEPCFLAVVRVDGLLAKSGQLAHIRFRSPHAEALGARFQAAVSRWFEKKTKPE